MQRNLSFVLAVALAAMGTLALGAKQSQKPAQPTPQQQARVERGAYLVRIAGCNDCHTPLKMGPKGPEPDFSRALSGHPEQMKMPAPPQLGNSPWMWSGAATNTAFAGPWGVSYAANLTPDRNTGLGIWTEEMFMKTVRTGRHWGVARPILPPMPWQNVAAMSDEDLRSIYAYLRTIKPIQNQVPDAVVAPPPAGGMK